MASRYFNILLDARSNPFDWSLPILLTGREPIRNEARPSTTMRSNNVSGALGAVLIHQGMNTACLLVAMPILNMANRAMLIAAHQRLHFGWQRINTAG